MAIEELAPADLASRTMVIEQHENIAWQRGMLLPWTQSQVSFLKDLVTLRNPRSAFSFVNYLHSVGRLDDFVNIANFLPFRVEISNYLNWVAQSLSSVRVEYGKKCVQIETTTGADGNVDGWHVTMADGSSIGAKTLVVGIGRDAHIPEVFADIPREKIVHSTEYSLRTADLDVTEPHRLVIVGAAQSAAEMVWETHQRFSNSQVTMVMRSVGLNYYQTSKFTNQLYFPSFTDEFYAARPEARRQVLHEMRRTNYAGVTPDMLDNLYRQTYLERLTGNQRLHMVTMVDITAAKLEGDDVVLTLTDRKSGLDEELRCDLVMLGTGFEPRMPGIVRALADAAGVDEVTVSRHYRMTMPPGVTASCYLQGTNEDSHGMADSLMSVLAVRAGEIVTDLLEHRAAAAGAAAAVSPVGSVPATADLPADLLARMATPA